MAHPLKDFMVPYRKGEIIFYEGEPGAEMYIVQSGRVEIYKLVGGEKRFLQVMEKGDFFGEMSLLEGIPRTATAEAVEDAEVIVINGATFDQMIKSNIEIAVRMLRKLSARLRETTDQFQKHLLEEGKAMPPAGDEVLPPQREQVAAGQERPPVIAQFLMEGSLKVFPIHRDISLIGRRDPVTGVVPDVDLTDEDVKRSVSRRHAKLIHSNGQFYLVEEVGTLNGTFVNGKRIPTGILTPIKSGSHVGFGTLRVKFVEPSQKKGGDA
jgi:CRP-like cAMP-binding protein